MSALVLALSGTDHHPFERMVSWLDFAAQCRPDIRFVVQHGHSSAPRIAEGHAFLPHAELVALMRQASVVVCHGGPGTIMDARAAGHVPLCMPRDPALGEHVDGHQQRFAAVVGEVGLVRLVPSVESMLVDIDGGVVIGPPQGTDRAADGVRTQALARAAHELDEVAAVRPPRLIRPRRPVQPVDLP